MTHSWSAQLLESVSIGRLFAASIVFFALSFLADFALKPRYPKSLPRVGFGEGIIPTLRNWVGYFLYFDEWVLKGYKDYSQNGRAFVAPSAASRPQEVIVPRSQTSWMLDLPDNVLSADAAHADMMHSDYQWLGADETRTIGVVRKNIARHIVGLIPEHEEEIHEAVEDVFGTDTENWTELKLWDAWMGMVPRITNRLLVGRPVCRDAGFLKAMVSFVDTVVMNSFFLEMFPKIAHPLIGRLVCISNYRLWRRAHAVLRPVIEQRLSDMFANPEAAIRPQTWQGSEDYLTWDIRQAMLENRNDALRPEDISKRLLPIEFAAIHTTVITGHFLMIDLLSSDPELGYIDTIREETSATLSEAGGQWTKDALQKLIRTDSAVRESMRVSNFATALTKRKVVAPEGVTNPTEGWHVPYGALLTLAITGTHHDEKLFGARAHQYDPFRFSRIREEYEARDTAKKTAEESTKVKMLGMVTTSNSHLPFGHGRHACPGRFFVAHEFKILLAFLLNNYDIKPLSEKPKCSWLGQTIIPPLDVKIQVRRRKETV